MGFLLGRPSGKSRHPQDLAITKGAEHGRFAEPAEEPSQRLRELGLEGGAEGFWVLLQPGQADGAIGGGIGWRQLADVNITEFHASLHSLPVIVANVLKILLPYGKFMLFKRNREYAAATGFTPRNGRSAASESPCNRLAIW